MLIPARAFTATFMMASDGINPYQSPLSIEAPPTQRDERPTGKLATRSARILALLVDGILEAASLFLILYLLGATHLFLADYRSWFETVVDGLLLILVYYLINSWLLATRGQTAGKLLMGIRIEDRDTSSLIPFSRQVLLRDLPILLPAHLFPVVTFGTEFADFEILIYVLDGLFIFTASRRCLHDRIANTKVVQTWS